MRFSAANHSNSLNSPYNFPGPLFEGSWPPKAAENFVVFLGEILQSNGPDLVNLGDYNFSPLVQGDQAIKGGSYKNSSDGRNVDFSTSGAIATQDASHGASASQSHRQSLSHPGSLNHAYPITRAPARYRLSKKTTRLTR